jgi:hypothetical protein
MNNFFSEFKRRHVDKVALVYVVVSWLLIELAWILLPTFDAPEWMLPTLVVLVAIGFLITLFISWSYEMTPEGLKRTADVSPDQVRVLPYWSKRKFATFIIGIAVIAFGLLAYQLLRLTPILQHRHAGKHKRLYNDECLRWTRKKNVPLRICAILPRIARQRRAGNGIAPRARITRVCFVYTAAEHIGRVAQERLAGAIALDTKGIEQSIIADDHLERLIWRQAVGKTGLADLVRIIRPLIPVSDKVRQGHPFNGKSIWSTRLSSRDLDGYV